MLGLLMLAPPLIDMIAGGVFLAQNKEEPQKEMPQWHLTVGPPKKMEDHFKKKHEEDLIKYSSCLAGADEEVWGTPVNPDEKDFKTWVLEHNIQEIVETEGEHRVSKKELGSFEKEFMDFIFLFDRVANIDDDGDDLIITVY